MSSTITGSAAVTPRRRSPRVRRSAGRRWRLNVSDRRGAPRAVPDANPVAVEEEDGREDPGVLLLDDTEQQVEGVGQGRAHSDRLQHPLLADQQRFGPLALGDVLRDRDEPQGAPPASA